MNTKQKGGALHTNAGFQKFPFKFTNCPDVVKIVDQYPKNAPQCQICPCSNGCKWLLDTRKKFEERLLEIEQQRDEVGTRVTMLRLHTLCLRLREALNP